MKKVELRADDLFYDKYKRFHAMMHAKHGEPTSYDHAAVIFESGEFMYIHAGVPPELRRPILYNKQEIGIRIVGTTDQACMQRYKFRTPKGDEIPYAHINEHGMYDLLVDEDTGVAVGVKYIGIADHEASHTHERVRKAIPQTLRTWARAYISGPGEAPVGSPITIYPMRQIEKAHRTHVMGLIAASKAWCQMTDNLPKLHGKSDPVSYFDLRLSNDFEEIGPELRKQLAWFGVVNQREPVVYECLMI